MALPPLSLLTAVPSLSLVARFLIFGEGLVAHWVEFVRGVLLFARAPGDDQSGEFSVYDRKRGRFVVLELADGVFGGHGSPNAQAPSSASSA